MNNLISSFSFYEVIRLLVPGSYTTLIFVDLMDKFRFFESYHFDFALGIILFLIVALLLGAFYYALDIPHWFSVNYETLPSNLIRINMDLDVPNNLTERYFKNANEYFENEYYLFYNSLEANSKLKTEFQAGLFYLCNTMAFISLMFTITYVLLLFFITYNIYYLLINIFIFILSTLTAFLMYKRKLKHTWLRNYMEFRTHLSTSSDPGSPNQDVPPT